MLKKKSTSLITLTLLLAVTGTPKSVKASVLTQSHNQLNYEQIAQATNSSEDDANSSEASSKFPWWLLILVAFVPFLGWFFLGRNAQVDQESVMAENLSAPFDSTSTNNNTYDSLSSEIETQNNLNTPTSTSTNFEDNTVMAASVPTVSNLTNELPKNNSFTRGISQTNAEEVEQLSQVDTDLTPTINQEPTNLFEEVNQTSQPLTADLENNLVDEVEQLSQVETNLTSTINQNLNALLDESNNVQPNNELIEDKIGNITEWLEQLDISFSSSDNKESNPNTLENFAEQNDNLDLSIELNEAESNQDLESFEQLLFGDLDNDQESKNQV
jgi:hypothetical protein